MVYPLEWTGTLCQYRISQHRNAIPSAGSSVMVLHNPKELHMGFNTMRKMKEDPLQGKFQLLYWQSQLGASLLACHLQHHTVCVCVCLRV